MPNIKSAKKRVSVTQSKTLRNKMAKSSLRTNIKKVQALTAGGDKAGADSAYIDAQREIDKAVAQGLLSKNTAARRKSRLQAAIKKA
ncbi:MAG: 30S ribosomal protein S20 [Oscillospiraceae bacterium]|nr:30S ribosomal protein S20 [Oscillospiraceae bacterium]